MFLTVTLQNSIVEIEKERQQHAIERHRRLEEERKQAPAKKVQMKEVEREAQEFFAGERSAHRGALRRGSGRTKLSVARSSCSR